ncbi:MAG: ATP-binding protein, partial [Pseudomonas sp.]
VDPLRLKQILSNLISNAIKFTEQGQVIVRLRLDEAQAQQIDVQLSVEDTGIGISAEEQQRLFHRFSQVGPSTERQGAGLGLVISRNLCELMGGTLTLQSTLNHGTQLQVRLTLPLAKPAPVVDTVPVPTSSHMPALSILVVDDYPANLMLLERQLSVLGHQVHQASDGQKALLLWQQQPFDVVITDCHMPGLDGHQLTRQIRLLEPELQRPACLILGLTANAQAQERERCLASGMSDCLFKPIGLAELRRHLHANESSVPTPSVETDANTSDFDINSLHYLTLGDPNLTNRLIRELSNSTQEDLDALRGLGHAPAREQLRALAHRIKGGAKMLKARG